MINFRDVSRLSCGKSRVFTLRQNLSINKDLGMNQTQPQFYDHSLLREVIFVLSIVLMKMDFCKARANEIFTG